MESCRPHFVTHKILTVTSIYIFESCKFIRKYPDFYSPVKYDNKRNNRNLNKLKTSFTKLKLVSSSPHNMLIKIYNHLPNYIKNQTSPKLFTKTLKEYLINKCYYNTQEFFNDKDNNK